MPRKAKKDAGAVVEAAAETPVVKKQEPKTMAEVLAAVAAGTLKPEDALRVLPAPRGGFGVNRTARTRAYYAGHVVKLHGLAAGITPAMVAEVDALFGKANAVESEICLRNAWHAVRAYTGYGEEEGTEAKAAG